jgi:hypothetical protein
MWHPVVAFAVLTDHRLSKCNPFQGISDDVNAKGLTSPKSRGEGLRLMGIDVIDIIDGMGWIGGCGG